MYRLIKVYDAMMTRFLDLENMQTGVIEKCFDDSDVVSDNNFNFMKIGDIYDCKIKLFGTVTDSTTDEGMFCRVLEEKVMLGKRKLVKVESNKGVYFISHEVVKDHKDKGYFYFWCTRKDLIQVNDIIHADYL